MCNVREERIYAIHKPCQGSSALFHSIQAVFILMTNWSSSAGKELNVNKEYLKFFSHTSSLELFE